MDTNNQRVESIQELINCKTISKFSFLNAYFIFVDTKEYLADGLFIKHQVRVHFGTEYSKPDSPYRIILCHVRKHDIPKFHAALQELQNKMIFLGYTDYAAACSKIWVKLYSAREERDD